MMPIPEALKKQMVSWLPHLLAGYDYEVIETDRIPPELASPAITFYVSSAGTPSQFSHQMIRSTVNDAQEREEWWGGYHYATFNVVLRAFDKDTAQAMWEDFIWKCQSTRRDYKIYLHKWRFLEILNSSPIETGRQKDGRELWWAQVDLRFEYEVSGPPGEDYIKKVNSEMQVGESEDHLTWTAEIKENVSINPKIVAFIAPYGD